MARARAGPEMLQTQNQLMQEQKLAQGQEGGLGEAGEKGGLGAGKNDLRRLMPPGTAGASGTILMTAVIHEKHLRDKYEHNGKGI